MPASTALQASRVPAVRPGLAAFGPRVSTKIPCLKGCDTPSGRHIQAKASRYWVLVQEESDGSMSIQPTELEPLLDEHDKPTQANGHSGPLMKLSDSDTKALSAQVAASHAASLELITGPQRAETTQTQFSVSESSAEELMKRLGAAEQCFMHAVTAAEGLQQQLAAAEEHARELEASLAAARSDAEGLKQREKDLIVELRQHSKRGAQDIALKAAAVAALAISIPVALGVRLTGWPNHQLDSLTCTPVGTVATLPIPKLATTCPCTPCATPTASAQLLEVLATSVAAGTQPAAVGVGGQTGAASQADSRVTSSTTRTSVQDDQDRRSSAHLPNADKIKANVKLPGSPNIEPQAAGDPPTHLNASPSSVGPSASPTTPASSSNIPTTSVTHSARGSPAATAASPTTGKGASSSTTAASSYLEALVALGICVLVLSDLYTGAATTSSPSRHT